MTNILVWFTEKTNAFIIRYMVYMVYCKKTNYY